MGIFSRPNANLIPVFALHDSAANAFAMPLFYASEGLAVRALSDAVNGGNKEISAHPQDYKLYCIGNYDPVTGVLTGKGPEMVVGAAALVAKP